MKRLLGLLGWCLAALVPAAAQTLQVVSTDNPPFNYLENDQPAGFATEVLNAMLQRANLAGHIEFLPWQRALLKVGQRPDTLIYTIARTPEREEQYQWIGPFAPREVWFWKMKARHDVRVDTLQDVRRYHVATVRADAQTELMQKMGLLSAGKDELLTNGDNVITMLYAHRVDLVANSELGMAWRLRQLKLDPAKIERSVLLVSNGGYYFALGAKASPQLVSRLRAAFEEVRASGLPERAMKAYLP
jgi:polar amino acid transport system substrate-binding protein